MWYSIIKFNNQIPLRRIRNFAKHFDVKIHVLKYFNDLIVCYCTSKYIVQAEDFTETLHGDMVLV